MRKLLAVILSLTCSGVADAGPILNLIEKRQEARNSRRHLPYPNNQYQPLSIQPTDYHLLSPKCSGSSCQLNPVYPNSQYLLPKDTNK